MPWALILEKIAVMANLKHICRLTLYEYCIKKTLIFELKNPLTLEELDYFNLALGVRFCVYVLDPF